MFMSPNPIGNTPDGPEPARRTLGDLLKSDFILEARLMTTSGGLDLNVHWAITTLSAFLGLQSIEHGIAASTASPIGYEPIVVADKANRICNGARDLLAGAGVPHVTDFTVAEDGPLYICTPTGRNYSIDLGAKQPWERISRIHVGCIYIAFTHELRPRPVLFICGTTGLSLLWTCQWLVRQPPDCLPLPGNWPGSEKYLEIMLTFAGLGQKPCARIAAHQCHPHIRTAMHIFNLELRTWTPINDRPKVTVTYSEHAAIKLVKVGDRTYGPGSCTFKVLAALLKNSMYDLFTYVGDITDCVDAAGNEYDHRTRTNCVGELVRNHPGLLAANPMGRNRFEWRVDVPFNKPPGFDLHGAPPVQPSASNL